MGTSQKWFLNVVPQDNDFSFTPAIPASKGVAQCTDIHTDPTLHPLLMQGEVEWRGFPAACLAGEHPTRLEQESVQESSLAQSSPHWRSPGVSVERVLCAWGQPYPVSSPARYAASTYLMRFYGFRHCKLYSLSQTSKTFLHLPSLTCQVSLGML